MSTATVTEALALAHDLIGHLDRAGLDQVVPQAERLVDLVRAVDPRGLDPFTARHLLSGALEVETSLRGRPSAPPASARLGVETIRQALLRITEGEQTSDERPLHELVSWLLGRLHVTTSELATILDVTPGTVRRWLTEPRDAALPESEEMQRARILGPVVASLSHVLTARGVVAWLMTPHEALKGQIPARLLGEAGAVADLISLASQGRSQVAS